MKTLRMRSLLLLAATLALAVLARADESVTNISFSDPAKPGTLRIRVWRGRVTVHGADVKDNAVRTETTAGAPTPRGDGMRVLSASSTYALTEKNNVVVLEYGSDGWSGAPADFDVTVPRTTSVTVANSVRGDFTCSGVSGDVDVRAMDGDVKLDDVSGGAVVETMNGDITVNSKTKLPQRPLCLTSMNGKVLIHVPTETKASIRFRTHRGIILTNFDDKALVTRVEVSRRTSKRETKAEAKASKEKHDSDSSEEAPEAPEAPETSAATPMTPDAPTADSDSDWHNDVRNSIKEAAEEAAMAAHEAAIAVHEGLAEFKMEYAGKLPPLPPMTGGKVVSGALNGGGVEIQASTLNGDIVLKKNE